MLLTRTNCLFGGHFFFAKAFYLSTSCFQKSTTMWSPDSGESADTDALPAPDQSQEEEEEEAVPIDIPQNELAVNSKAPTMVPSETEAANHQSLMAPPPHATGTAASSEEIEIRDNEDAGFIKDTDDDDDDDNESKPPEVFSDEPEEGTKQKKRFRSKMPFGSSKFKQNNPNHRKKSSCWSSDEGAGITEPYRLARRKQKNLSSNPELEAPMPPATDSAGVGFASRNRKPKSKRRLGKNHAEGSESSEHSSSLEEYQTSTPVHTSQRKAPHTLNSASKSGVDEFPSTVEIRAPGTNSNHFSSSKKKRQSSSSVASAPPAFKKVPLHLSIEDMEICQRLDDEYENALEEREIGYMARYTSVRQAACFSVAFMLLFLFVGTNFFMRYSEWSVHDSLLFSIYTITTVGYGHISIPNTWGFQVYVILYIIVGIATLTIMVRNLFLKFCLDNG